MSEPTNIARAEWAKAACDHFAGLVRQHPEHEADEVTRDLLADIAHLLAMRGQDPAEVFAGALETFREEREEEADRIKRLGGGDE